MSDGKRRFAGNLGYDDVHDEQYVWDSTVPHHRNVSAGDLVLIRDSDFVLGVAWIDEISTTPSRKLRRRCTKCRKTKLKVRRGLSPRYRCVACGATCDAPMEEEISVIAFSAHYGRTWRAVPYLPVTALSTLYEDGAKQNAIRPLDYDRSWHLLTGAAHIETHWWSERTPGSGEVYLPGGHRLRLGRARVGQAGFRNHLRQRHGDVCAVSGPQYPAALEAAHLYRYCEKGEHDPEGGLLLRRDLHALFDHFLVTIDPSSWTVRVSPALSAFPDVSRFDGRPVSVAPSARPDADYLDVHFTSAVNVWMSAGALPHHAAEPRPANPQHPG